MNVEVHFGIKDTKVKVTKSEITPLQTARLTEPSPRAMDKQLLRDAASLHIIAKFL